MLGKKNKKFVKARQYLGKPHFSNSSCLLRYSEHSKCFSNLNSRIFLCFSLGSLRRKTYFCQSKTDLSDK